MKLSRLAPLFVVLILAPFSQGQDKKKVTFKDHVLPILENRCLNCHNPDETKGGLDLSTFSATMTGGS
ncbi:MAG: c-type cytochrome domain-containing protein, partial [Verrucomicrobiales bacterium]